ncbi:MAG: hypothetical protein QXS49_01405 [Ferroplasma sp.]|jgi:hypothetical protein
MQILNLKMIYVNDPSMSEGFENMKESQELDLKDTHMENQSL